MRKIIVVILIGMVLFFGATASLYFSTTASVKAENVAPPYAKWGKLAMTKTKEKYPNAAIMDYLHIGRVEGAKTTMERFKLWLKEKNKEFGVMVTIEFEKDTDKIIKISINEVER